MTSKPVPKVEPATLALLVACYGALMLTTTVIASTALPVAMVLTVLLVTLHSSLQHEALHGHPTRKKWLNEILVFPAVGLFVPYGRFRDTHLDHHQDSILTDPYDDPESNYLDPRVWVGLPRPVQLVLRFNNTLMGRILLGPLISMIRFVTGDFRAAIGGQYKIILCWGLHFLGLVPVIWWLLAVGSMPLWAYGIAAYLGFGVLKIRTFLEHRAHVAAPARTVVIEDRGLLSLLFLNNNFHAVHHSHPGAPWYHLPALYFKDRQGFLDRNDGYFYPNYRAVLRRYFFHAKDPVPHPIYRGIRPD